MFINQSSLSDYEQFDVSTEALNRVSNQMIFVLNSRFSIVSQFHYLNAILSFPNA